HPDYVLEMLLEHDGVDLTYEECIGVTYEEVHSNADLALTKIVQKYGAIASRCDAVVIVGSDYTDVASPTELAFNARIAVNLGAPVLLVVRRAGRTPAEVGHVADLTLAELRQARAQVVGVIGNRVRPDDVYQVRRELENRGVAAWTIPEDPMLAAPTVRQLMDACEGELLSGDKDLLSREVLDVVVGAMSMEHVLDHLSDGATVLTPGDRDAVALALLTAHAAEGFPSLSAMILNGGLMPSPQVLRLMEGLGQRLPIISTSLDTFEAATAISRVRGRLSMESQRKIDTSLSMFEQHVDVPRLRSLLQVSATDVVTPLMFEYQLLEQARSDRKHIVLPEGTDDRILRAAGTLLQRQVADLTLLGPEAPIRARATELGLDISAANVIDPHESELRERFAQEYAEIRAHRGMTVDRAREVVTSVSYFGTLMVHAGMADGMVSGAAHTTAHTIRPAFEIIKTTPDVSIVSSVFLMCLEDRVLVYGDCAVNPDPTDEQLADIAISSAQTAAQFGVDQRIAMLSYSTGESGTGAGVDKVRSATELVRNRRPDLSVEGPIQYDAAVDVSVASTKLPESAVAGHATVFIFPDLNTGNNTYKAVQRTAGAVAVGPVLQGLRRPVNDLSRGALVQDIVNTVAITAIQAQQVKDS
ncbi:MAG TPA: phosphate acetyltransferase, partial [Actinomycetales bacterium]|nr:phosphate acetyltransferase [Actinomycetales bacterium]